MQQLKVQPQLLRNLLQAETENNRDDLFIFRLNGKLLHFGKREFCVVTGLRFDKKSDFYSDFKAPNKLMSKYYPGIEKVAKQFTEIKQYVVESVKTILNELRSARIKSNEFNEDRKNDSQSVDDLLQTSHGSKTCEEISNEPINMKDELSHDTASKKDGNVTLT
ncbi:hypothetical protein T459_20741 [Capsicum annuum]|uniref:DUF1985 domain-containing protein n=1 Tax=Capsicum annuum TaxID=4072 RepID=A0A2G2Z5G2_CAPAN|nr:hypothetical protein T459_20741 [Capsicum annuum]